MRRAGLGSARAIPLSTRIGAQYATVLCAGPIRSCSLLSTAVNAAARPHHYHVPFTTPASTTWRRLGLSGLAQPLRAGFRSNLPGRRRYSTDAPAAPETAKVAETPVSLDVLRAEFNEFQKQTLTWNVAGMPVPEPVVWLVILQFLGLGSYSFALERNESIVFVREHMDALLHSGALGDDQDQPRGPGFTRRLTSWERTAVNGVISGAVFLGIAFLWARARTRRSFEDFVLLRATGQTRGTYPIAKEHVVYNGDVIKITSEGIKGVRNEVVRLAGLKAVQASAGLLLAYAASSYAFTTWLDDKMKDGVIRFRHSDVLQGEAVLIMILLFNFLVSFAALVYQPYTLFPLAISNILRPYLPCADRKYKYITVPAVKEKPVVTENTSMVDADGGKEHITVTEKTSGSGFSRTEARVFSSDEEDAKHSLEPRERSDDSTTTKTNTDTADS